MIMVFSSKIQIDATPEKIWAKYANVREWSSWDSEVREAYLNKGLSFSSEGFLIPRKGPKASIRVVQFEENRNFTVQSRLPLCRLNFEHYITDMNGSSAVEHKIVFTGVLAPLFSRLIGRQIYKAMPDTLAALKTSVEGN